jgi:hypothetical protein
VGIRTSSILELEVEVTFSKTIAEFNKRICDRSQINKEGIT